MVLSLALIASAMVALPALAAENAPGRPNNDRSGLMRDLAQKLGLSKEKPQIVGIVTTINGKILTITARPGFGSTTPATATIFTVDATNASVIKGKATSSIAQIAVGDMVIVQGAISGTNVTAKTIRDSNIQQRLKKEIKEEKKQERIDGNGQPIVAGTISAITSSSSITITNKSNVTYTVDVASAKIYQGQRATSTFSNLKIGNNVVVQGTVNGTAIVASTIIDQNKPAIKPRPGFVRGIGQFFRGLFGF